ncbi:hypothetical protein N7492_001869 [Penicillium capsulatum]|uniref:Uncharacterized protein n=1 Tax=Penicillium capsulatum TaxID=69766 RepID=A0A9W9M038_9EURO|nr:hypothetical protein N7492_001869 [Penicillium capsulatum]KAJ6129083.1 hypothetical protein N7512_001863 [Penicillium capsulatum]
MASKDSFMKYRSLVREKLLTCILELGKEAKDPLSRNNAVIEVLRSIREEDLKGLQSTAEIEADNKVKRIPRCFSMRLRTMREQLRYFIEGLQQGGGWVVYVIVCLELFRVYVGRTTLYNDSKSDPSAAEIDNQWSVTMDQQLNSDHVKQLIHDAVNSMPSNTMPSFADCYGDLKTVWGILNEPVATCPCRQCSLRRGFRVDFLRK